MTKIDIEAMRQQIEKAIVESSVEGHTDLNDLTNKLLDLFDVSKSFATATETTDSIVKGSKYEIVDEEQMGYYIIDESGESTYYHHSALNVC